MSNRRLSSLLPFFNVMKATIILFCLPLSVNAFGVLVGSNFHSSPRSFTATTTRPHPPPQTTTALYYAAPEMETMKLRDIQGELKNLGVPYGDCFDRDSLLCRLRDAREGKVATATRGAASNDDGNNEVFSTTVPQPDLDADSILADLRSQALKDLKLQCSRRNLRYAAFLEKEDFVQAIWKDMQAVALFSVSGGLRPGKATEITGEQLDQEISSHETPILLDVYATWCGPCKMMAPEMEKVAEELGSKCRVAKLDSDQHPEWAGRYKVQGLPTILLIHRGQVQERLEGAFMKDKLLEMVQPYI